MAIGPSVGFTLDIPVALVIDVRTLTACLGQAVEEVLGRFGDTVRDAVPSYQGLTLTMVINDLPVILTEKDRRDLPWDIAASVGVPVAVLTRPDSGGVLVLYAAAAGAFVDLAADLAFIFGLPTEAVLLDQHLFPPRNSSGSGLSDMSALNQAVGFLIGIGQTPQSAQAMLENHAKRTDVTVYVAARKLIATGDPANLIPTQGEL